MPTLDALITLSEGRRIGRHRIAHAREAAADFIERSKIGYVVIDLARTSPELRALAIDVFALKLVEVSEGRELYVPGARH